MDTIGRIDEIRYDMIKIIDSIVKNKLMYGTNLFTCAS